MIIMHYFFNNISPLNLEMDCKTTSDNEIILPKFNASVLLSFRKSPDVLLAVVNSKYLPLVFSYISNENYT